MVRAGVEESRFLSLYTLSICSRLEQTTQIRGHQGPSSRPCSEGNLHRRLGVLVSSFIETCGERNFAARMPGGSADLSCQPWAGWWQRSPRTLSVCLYHTSSFLAVLACWPAHAMMGACHLETDQLPKGSTSTYVSSPTPDITHPGYR
jgi:hypothetical protein